MYGFTFALAALLAAAAPQTTAAGARGTPSESATPLSAPDQDGPPVVDIALRTIRTAAGGSSIARSAARGDAAAFLYAGLGPCIVGASAEDPAHPNSITWRASGRVRSVERGIAVADVEWQRLEYRPSGAVAGSRVRTTLTLPLGERVAVDFVDVAGSACRTDGLIFEIGIAPDHGRRLAMTSEGRPLTGAAGARAGGGGDAVGRRLTPAQTEPLTERQHQAAEAMRASVVVTRPMPPREYTVDVWLVQDATGASTTSALAQRLSQAIGGTGGRFAFPPIASGGGAADSSVVDISALVIPVGGDQLIVAITRHITPGDGSPAHSAGWIKAVPLPTPTDVLSFEIPADPSDAAIGSREAYGLRVRVGR
jgi:hypothetical protein